MSIYYNIQIKLDNVHNVHYDNKKLHGDNMNLHDDNI